MAIWYMCYGDSFRAAVPIITSYRLVNYQRIPPRKVKLMIFGTFAPLFLLPRKEKFILVMQFHIWTHKTLSDNTGASNHVVSEGSRQPFNAIIPSLIYSVWYLNYFRSCTSTSCLSSTNPGWAHVCVISNMIVCMISTLSIPHPRTENGGWPGRVPHGFILVLRNNRWSPMLNDEPSYFQFELIEVPKCMRHIRLN
jgi:hypothetical protein